MAPRYHALLCDLVPPLFCLCDSDGIGSVPNNGISGFSLHFSVPSSTSVFSVTKIPFLFS
jgi:hypothetical protein